MACMIDPLGKPAIGGQVTEGKPLAAAVELTEGLLVGEFWCTYLRSLTGSSCITAAQEKDKQDDC